MYRLARGADGELVLQGLFVSRKTDECGQLVDAQSEWRTIPTVMLEGPYK